MEGDILDVVLLTRDTKIDVFVSMEFKIYPVFLKVVP
jgi:hypothetical protein